MMKNITRLIICFIPVCFFTSAYAENLITTDDVEPVREYNIEIVIFEDTSNRYTDTEKFNFDEAELNFSDSNDASSDNSVINIAPSAEELALSKYAKKLKSTGRFHILVHKSWVQAGLDAETAINIPINSRTQIENNLPVPGIVGTNPLAVDNVSSVVGNIKVILGRYLHVHTNLIYKRFLKNKNPLLIDESNYKEFVIKSHRKMRSKELHYIDHPFLGILVQALPVELKQNVNGGDIDKT